MWKEPVVYVENLASRQHSLYVGVSKLCYATRRSYPNKIAFAALPRCVFYQEIAWKKRY